MHCLIIDNYDSFTWNIVDYVTQVFGEQPSVVRNDQYTWQEIKNKYTFDCIIVSPGPGSVTNKSDFYSSYDALQQDEVPVLGVCLGFQGLAKLYGANITLAPVPYHGRSSLVHHNSHSLFTNIPTAFNVIRYHSLMVSPDIPEQLEVIAQTESGLLMALAHKILPKWGVQFHPESILSEFGHQLIQNFHDLALQHNQLAGGNEAATAKAFLPDNTLYTEQKSPQVTSQYCVVSRKLNINTAPENIFHHLFAHEKNCFWLDSQNAGADEANFSFMGAVNDDALYQYNLKDDNENFAVGHKFLNRLDDVLEHANVDNADELPFQFRGGLIGFLSYEMRVLFAKDDFSPSAFPDALWMHVDHFVAFDHVTNNVWVVAVGDVKNKSLLAEQLEATVSRLHTCPPVVSSVDVAEVDCIKIHMALNAEQYKKSIEECRDSIVKGESYELCLTNKFTLHTKVNAFNLYKQMRADNAAPFGAYIKSGKHCVLSTSPERFLKVDQRGVVETKPIKGTISRSVDPIQDKLNAKVLQQSEKDRAENLMIVDLMRNDLSRVSLSGSVKVPKLMAVESYKTVHHLVSTVTSTLKPNSTLIDLIKATFPGGSISGAPKIRSMKILQQLEGFSRGVYCGAIGYLGYNRIADLNIAIRTLSYDGEKIEFGAGGAITYLSDTNNEYDEILLKAEAVLAPTVKALQGEYTSSDREIVDGVIVVSTQHALCD